MDSETESSIAHSLPRDEQALIEFLRDRDITCPGCSYNLRGLVSGQCPECGKALRLGVHLAEPYLKAWIFLMVVTCASASMGCFFTLLVIIDGWPNRQRWQVNVGIVISMLTIPLVPLIIMKRRRFLRFSHTKQWTLGCMTLAALMTSLIFILSGVR